MKFQVAVTLSMFMIVVVLGDEAPVVATLEGRISGVLEKSTKNKVFYSYYSVPFAMPPLGSLRLKDPVPTKPWEDVLNGSVLPEMCLQVPFVDTVAGVKLPPQDLTGSEDCLYLNVFTPKDAAGLPVIVYIHGGGYFSGGAREYLPHVLLNHDIVLVVLQYRLGTLGFLSTEDSVIPGNFGLKDQTLALQWVQKNIHNFGGDKSKVTIMGQSAGAASVHYHILSPKSSGLFARAIMHSGTALSPWALTRTHRAQAMYVAEILGCPTLEGSEALLKCLQAADAPALAALAQDFFKWFILPMTLSPRVDGDFVPDEPGLLLREGRYTKVDLLAGAVSHEGAMFTHAMLTNEDLVSALESNFQTIGPLSLQCHTESDDPAGLALQVYHYYLGQGKLDPLAQSEQLTQMFSDRLVNVDLEQLMLQQARQSINTTTFRYLLTHRAQLSFTDCNTQAGRHWVSHGDDLYYLFRGGPLLQPPQQSPQRLHDLQRQDDLALRDIMTTLWTNFATTGTPTPDDSLGFIWEPVTDDNLHYLALDPIPTMEADIRHEVRRFHSSLPTLVNLALHPQVVTHHSPAWEDSHTAPGDTDDAREEL